MAKVKADQIQNDDFVEYNGIKGMLYDVQKYGKDIYAKVMTSDKVIKQLYLKETDEIIKLRKTKAMAKALEYNIVKQKVRSLGKMCYEVGSDPEMFVINKQSGEVIPSFEFLKSKEENDKTAATRQVVSNHLSNVSGNQNIFWDGFQAEFNTTAQSCLSWVVDSVYIGLRTLRDKAKAHNPKAELTIQPTINIPQEMLENAKKEHVEFGCMPSKNAYGLKGLAKDGRQVPFRSAGGHIHFGCSKYLTDKVDADKYVKCLDMILGVACVSLFAKYDDPKRRLMYGLAGEYRTPKHGLEYRTLSNAWMCHPVIMNIVFEMARKITAVAHDDKIISAWLSDEQEIIKCINECDVVLAREILDRNKEMFKDLIYSFTSSDERVNVIYNTFMLGVECLIQDPDDLLNNWGLDKMWVGHNEGAGTKIGNMQALKTYNDLAKMKLEA